MYQSTLNFIKNSIDLSEMKKGELWKSIVIVSAITGPIIAGAALVNNFSSDHKDKSSYVKVIDENTKEINQNSFLVKEKDKNIEVEKTEPSVWNKFQTLVHEDVKPKNNDIEMGM